ncbi:hypothetical protein [Flavobacterium beibuense]|uniref:Histidine kinase-like ATPase n=1 Tax=Flavobacterium beibuense TaxID=657326 RepID=A0A444WAP5_9FLAO|nr:hypothetical protein [Flavobacterium beibuense]RYJ42884.1 Histidine kinase-like ATPase [Flavobacterium beibuense]
MKELIILVPKYLFFEDTIEFINSFKDLRNSKKYIFDFKNLIRIDSISLLLLSSEIHLFKKANSESEFIAKNFTHCTYPAHMGFFQSFGLNHGKFPGEAKNNNRYIPIRIYKTNDIKQVARDMFVNPGEILEDFAAEISNVLTQGKDENLFEILKYCVREILRNIVEHSESDKFGFCAQYLPSLNKVSFAVLDRGIGIRKSISNNPKLNISTDLEAIQQSLLPGVSGKVYAGQKRKPKGEWANSGYGLFMTSNICLNGGSFFIASGNNGIFKSEKEDKIINIKIDGTALNLTINLNQKNDLNEVLKNLRDNVSSKVNITASKSSMNKHTRSLHNKEIN